jgi:hypothetical protein
MGNYRNRRLPGRQKSSKSSSQLEEHQLTDMYTAFKPTYPLISGLLIQCSNYFDPTLIKQLTWLLRYCGNGRLKKCFMLGLTFNISIFLGLTANLSLDRTTKLPTA